MSKLIKLKLFFPELVATPHMISKMHPHEFELWVNPLHVSEVKRAMVDDILVTRIYKSPDEGRSIYVVETPDQINELIAEASI